MILAVSFLLRPIFIIGDRNMFTRKPSLYTRELVLALLQYFCAMSKLVVYMALALPCRDRFCPYQIRAQCRSEGAGPSVRFKLFCSTSRGSKFSRDVSVCQSRKLIFLKTENCIVRRKRVTLDSNRQCRMTGIYRFQVWNIAGILPR